MSVKSVIESLLPGKELLLKSPNLSEDEVFTEIRNILMCCALLASAEGSNWELMNWVPEKACSAATDCFKKLGKFNCLGLECGLVESDVKSLVEELAPEVFPKLKESINASAIDRSDDANLVSAACARAPVAYAIIAAYQFRWFVTQVYVLIVFVFFFCLKYVF